VKVNVLLATLVLAACTANSAPLSSYSVLPVAQSAQRVRPAVPSIGGCAIFPNSSSAEYKGFNNNISGYPLDPLSSSYISQYPGHVQLNMGSSPWAKPINFVPADQKLVPAKVEYTRESDPGPYPLPANALIQSGHDHALIVVQEGKCLLWEAWHATYSSSTGWSVGSIAKWNLTTGDQRFPIPRGGTVEAGTPDMPGLIRCQDMQNGVINHSIEVGMAASQEGFIFPAENYTIVQGTRPTLMPMGARIRLAPSYDISRFTGQAHIIVEAMKNYGLFFETLTGPSYNWTIVGQGDDTSCWNQSQLNQLTSIPSTAFQVVETGAIQR
jgi:hypothetical protein